jgi:hypothetical protein
MLGEIRDREVLAAAPPGQLVLSQVPQYHGLSQYPQFPQ